jgi:hypothetical protein
MGIFPLATAIFRLAKAMFLFFTAISSRKMWKIAVCGGNIVVEDGNIAVDNRNIVGGDRDVEVGDRKVEETKRKLFLFSKKCVSLQRFPSILNWASG